MSAARVWTVAARRVWLCDLDGTLVDSAPAHEEAFREAIAELAPSGARVFRYADTPGRAPPAWPPPDRGPDVAGRLVRRKQQLYREHVEAGKVRLFPGALRLLDRLAADGGRRTWSPAAVAGRWSGSWRRAG